MAEPITFVTVDRTTWLPQTKTTTAILDKVEADLLAERDADLTQALSGIRTAVGNLPSLATSEKADLVGAINEIFGLLGQIDGSAGIDDSQATTSSVYSSSKVVSLIAALKTAIIGGADTGVDSFGEVQSLLITLRTDVNNRVTGTDLYEATRYKADLVDGKVPAAQLPAQTGVSYPPSGGIPLTDLSTGVRSSLTKADGAYTKPTNGITTSDLSPTIGTSLTKADSAYQKPSTGVPLADLASGVQSSLTKADSAVQPAALASKADASALSTKADLVGGVIPTSQIPAIALGTQVPVASRAAMLALTSSQVQPGDLALDSSTGTTRGTYILIAPDPSLIANWALLISPLDAVQSVAGKIGVVALTKGDVGLGSVDNTADSAKPISLAQATVNANKADLVSGKVPISQLPASITGGTVWVYQNADGTWPSIAGIDDATTINFSGPDITNAPTTHARSFYVRKTS